MASTTSRTALPSVTDRRADTDAGAGSPNFPAATRGRNALAQWGPNWFAAVMGTGIVATAAISLPRQVSGLRDFALIVWALAAGLLVVLFAATAAHWFWHPATARAHASHPVMSHFYGAPPMAMLTVGAGALLVGKDLIGIPAAVDVDWVLWTAGTITGLACAVIVPYLAFTRHHYCPDAAFGGWLMPVVPPMVSATTGALLVPYAAAGQARQTLLGACYAMFGLSLFSSLIIITLIWGRLVQHKVGAAAAVPTLWIVLGPLGQSITAVNLMGACAQLTLRVPYAAAAAGLGLVYGLATFGFAALWLAHRDRCHRPHRPPTAALQPHLVELHLPRRDPGHRHQCPGQGHRPGRPGLDRRRPLHRPAHRMDNRVHSHHPKRPERATPAARARIAPQPPSVRLDVRVKASLTEQGRAPVAPWDPVVLAHHQRVVCQVLIVPRRANGRSRLPGAHIRSDSGGLMRQLICCRTTHACEYQMSPRALSWDGYQG
jgi:tellurite resistance protein TehA-like permease